MPEKITTPEQATNSTSKNVLNVDVEIKGNIKFSGELTFDGRLEGEIHTDGVLHVGENAQVTGNVNAQAVISRGKINGNVSAKDKIELRARSELFGDIRAAKLVMEEGVTFVGKIEVNPNKVAPTAPLRSGDMPKVLETGKPGGR